jgi:diacylglycerol kinase family enzyme
VSGPRRGILFLNPRAGAGVPRAGLRSFVVAGGDGTVHHVAQALVQTEGILGVLPVDTAKRHLRVALDGELVDMQTPLQIAAVPASLLVRAPA